MIEKIPQGDSGQIELLKSELEKMIENIGQLPVIQIFKQFRLEVDAKNGGNVADGKVISEILDGFSSHPDVKLYNDVVLKLEQIRTSLDKSIS